MLLAKVAKTRSRGIGDSDIRRQILYIIPFVDILPRSQSPRKLTLFLDLKHRNAFEKREMRPVFDLSTLNQFLLLSQFKMETIVLVLSPIRCEDWIYPLT